MKSRFVGGHKVWYVLLVLQVIDQCRDVHATRQRNLSEDPSGLPKTATKAAGGKDWSAFRVALVAAKRKSKPSSSRI